MRFPYVNCPISQWWLCRSRRSGRYWAVVGICSSWRRNVLRMNEAEADIKAALELARRAERAERDAKILKELQDDERLAAAVVDDRRPRAEDELDRD